MYCATAYLLFGLNDKIIIDHAVVAICYLLVTDKVTIIAGLYLCFLALLFNWCAGPTSFAPFIYAAISVVENSNWQYHVLMIIADGQVTCS
jgi:hypothetical protein